MSEMVTKNPSQDDQRGCLDLLKMCKNRLTYITRICIKGQKTPERQFLQIRKQFFNAYCNQMRIS